MGSQYRRREESIAEPLIESNYGAVILDGNKVWVGAGRASRIALNGG